MASLLTVERIKLFSTRSPYWCLALIPLLAVGLTLLISLVDDGRGAGLENSQQWTGFAVSIVMVMAALAITTEYRFGTIRTSFLAVPARTRVLVAKAVLLAGLTFVVVLLTSLLTYVLARTVNGPLARTEDFAIESAGDWRVLWGPAAVCAMAAVLAVGVGALIRQSAGAIAVLLLWPLLIENLFVLFGEFGRNVYPWLPFVASGRLYAGEIADTSSPGPFGPALSMPNWWQGGLVFLGAALLMFGLGVLVANRRDA